MDDALLLTVLFAFIVAVHFYVAYTWKPNEAIPMILSPFLVIVWIMIIRKIQKRTCTWEMCKALYLYLHLQRRIVWYKIQSRSDYFVNGFYFHRGDVAMDSAIEALLNAENYRAFWTHYNDAKRFYFE